MGRITRKLNRCNDESSQISLRRRFLDVDVADRYLGELGRELVRAGGAKDPRVKLDALRLIQMQPGTVRQLFGCEGIA